MFRWCVLFVADRALAGSLTALLWHGVARVFVSDAFLPSQFAMFAHLS